MTPGVLTAGDDRAVRKAVDAYRSEGALRSRVDADIVIGTARQQYLLRSGRCVASTIAEIEGAVLIGWLVSYRRASGVVAAWQRGSRAVLLGDDRVHVTPTTTFLGVDGTRVNDGFVTQEARFFAGHSDPEDDAPSSSPSAQSPSALALPDLLDSFGEGEVDWEAPTPVRGLHDAPPLYSR